MKRNVVAVGRGAGTASRQFITLSGLLLAALLALPAAGQDPPPADSLAASTADGAADEAPVVQRNLLAMIQDGGVLMIPLFACSFIVLVFFFERAISLRRARVIPAPFVKRFMHQLREGKLDRDQALDLCQESTSPVAEVFAGAVRKWGRPAVEIEQAIIDAQERVAIGLRRCLRLFNGVATISPLLGLLGTVFGMIRIFNDISHSDAMGRAERLAGGISEAMITTATGLLVAIPAMCFYLYFGSRVERLITDIDTHSQELVGQISAEALHDDRNRAARASRRGTAA